MCGSLARFWLWRSDHKLWSHLHFLRGSVTHWTVGNRVKKNLHSPVTVLHYYSVTHHWAPSMTTVAYLRVSTIGQSESGLGLEAQLAACRKAGTVDHVFQDAGVSGATGLDKRPGLLTAIAALTKGDILVVAKRDRLGRDPIAVAMIERAVARKGARIVSAAGEGTDSDDPSAILMRRMIDAFSEYERLVIGARTKAALGAKKARGERSGSIPYGYQLAADGVHLEKNAKEQEIIRIIERLHAAGESYRAIGAELTARGLKGRGASWNPKTIGNIIHAHENQR